jgi:hypothetical protein
MKDSNEAARLAGIPPPPKQPQLIPHGTRMNGVTGRSVMVRGNLRGSLEQTLIGGNGWSEPVRVSFGKVMG